MMVNICYLFKLVQSKIKFLSIYFYCNKINSKGKAFVFFSY